MKYVNNPLNIKHSLKNKWRGSFSQPDDKFESFTAVAFCVRAWCYIIDSYANRGIYTIESIVKTYCPDETAISYLDTLEMIDPKLSRSRIIDVYNFFDACTLCQAMCRVESSFYLDLSTFKKGYCLFINDRI